MRQNLRVFELHKSLCLHLCNLSITRQFLFILDFDFLELLLSLFKSLLIGYVKLEMFQHEERHKHVWSINN